MHLHRAQVSRCNGLCGSGREFPALTGRSGTQRAQPLRPELAAPLGVCPSPRSVGVQVVVLAGGCQGTLLYFAAVRRLPYRLTCRAGRYLADLPPFRPEVSPSRHANCECSCVLPTADVCRDWALSGTGLVFEFRSTVRRPPLAGLRPGSLHGFHGRPCFRVRRELAQDEGEGGRAHGVGVAVAHDAAAAAQDVFVQLLGRLVLAQLGQLADEDEGGQQAVGVVLTQDAAAGQGVFGQIPGRLVLAAVKNDGGQVAGRGQGVSGLATVGAGS